MGNWLPWIILGAVAIGGYLFVYKPLTAPGGRQIIGGILSGNQADLGKGAIKFIDSNPQVKQQILNDPEKMKKYNELKQKYGANYARVSVYGR
jgi:hypothetical protein